MSSESKPKSESLLKKGVNKKSKNDVDDDGILELSTELEKCRL